MKEKFDKIVSHYFTGLEQKDFIELQHAHSLKGFLKPFKGNTLREWASQCEQLRDQLIVLGRTHVLQQAKAYPFALLPIQMAQQTTGTGTAFLRWRTTDRAIMGVHLWDELINNSNTSSHLIADLYAMEIQRIVLNMQISLTHAIMRQSRECAKKLFHAQDVFDKRIE